MLRSLITTCGGPSVQCHHECVLKVANRSHVSAIAFFDIRYAVVVGRVLQIKLIGEDVAQLPGVDGRVDEERRRHRRGERVLREIT